MQKRMKQWRPMFQTVAHLLLTEWDPIGIQQFPEAHDEYDSYALQVCSLLLQLRSESDIVDTLQKIAVEQMGLPAPRRDKTERLVQKLIQLLL